MTMRAYLRKILDDFTTEFLDICENERSRTEDLVDEDIYNDEPMAWEIGRSTNVLRELKLEEKVTYFSRLLPSETASILNSLWQDYGYKSSIAEVLLAEIRDKKVGSIWYEELLTKTKHRPTEVKDWPVDLDAAYKN